MLMRYPLTRAIGMLLPLLPCTASAVTLDYLLGFGVEHNDNVNLSDTDPISSNILIPSLGFTLNQQGSTIQASANGLFEYRDYLNGGFADEFRGQLSGRLNWTIAPQRLDLTVEDYLAEQPIDNLQPDTPSNLQQTNVIAIGPTFRFRLGSTVRGQAELRYINSYADESDEFNTNRISAAFRGIKELSPSSEISANLVDEHVDFIRNDVGPDYDRQSAFARYWRQWTRLSLVADAGWSWIRFSDDGEDRSEPLARAGLNWRLNERSHFTLDLSHQISDAASGALGESTTLNVDLGAAIPSSIDIGNGAITAAPYIENRIGIGYAYEGVRTTFAVTPLYHKLEYVDQSQPDQTGRGGVLSFTRRLRPLLTFGFIASGENIRYAGLDRSDKTRTLQVFLEREWSRRWVSRIEFTRHTRDSNADTQNGDQNIIFVEIEYRR